MTSSAPRPDVQSSGPRTRLVESPLLRPVIGFGFVLLLGAIIACSITLFRGGFTSSVPVTVVSPRAGLVMNPGARVTLHGAQVGSVQSIDSGTDGTATLHLALDSSLLHLIPANVDIRIASPTVFGAKAVQLIPPANASTTAVHAGQVLDATHVTVELNTIFQQLTSVLAKIQPEKLNETLGAMATGLHGQGEQFGQSLVDLERILATLEPGLPNLRRDLASAPVAIGAYADAGPDLVTTLDNAATISDSIVDQQHRLDALLVSVIGFADTGSDVIGTNSQPLTTVLQLLTSTTDLTNEYHEALGCGLGGMVPYAMEPPPPVPGILTTIGLQLGKERYRYPGNLPKVAATGHPSCTQQGLPDVPAGMSPPFVVTDIGANPAEYGNTGIVLNADGLKQLLFGPIDGPPRNVAQIGQPG